jgi:HAD superfamily hydrolase (TIGR01549 family)
LLDFGGVLVDIVHRAGALREVALEVHSLLRRERANGIDAARVERDIRAAWEAYDRWKSAEGRRAHPREIAHREFWTDFVAADWPATARDVVSEHATELCERLDVATKDRPPKPDALHTLRGLADRGLRAAIVSNALCGAGSRKLVRAYGFEPYLAAQVYSDEAGVRKPNPDLFASAAGLLGADLGRCWYVGDTIDRDVLGARRAGVAKVILLPSRQTGRGLDAIAEPDATIARPSDLLALLPASLSRP